MHKHTQAYRSEAASITIKTEEKMKNHTDYCKTFGSYIAIRNLYIIYTLNTTNS